MKTFFASLIGLVATIIAYSIINLPILPAVTVYLVANLFQDGNTLSRGRMVGIWVVSLLGAFLWGFSAVFSIIHYPENLSVLGIIFAVVNTIAYLGAAGFFTLISLAYSKMQEDI